MAVTPATPAVNGEHDSDTPTLGPESEPPPQPLQVQDEQPPPLRAQQAPVGPEQEDDPSPRALDLKVAEATSQPTKFGWFAFGLELLGFILALFFLVLGILVATLDNKPLTDGNEAVGQASRVAASFWPVLFAAVLGAAGKTLARLMTEKGGNLVHIEHLVGSQTFAGVLFTPIQLRFFHVQSVVVILLWAFNPLGTQAIIRAVATRENTELRELDTPMQFASSNFFSDVAVVFQLMGHEEEFLDPLIASPLYAPEAGLQNMGGIADDYDARVRSLGSGDLVRFASDAWGNVRIPKLESLPDYDEKRPEEWVRVPYQTRLIDYASLIGVRVEGLPKDIVGNISWRIEANYHNFECDPLHVLEFDRAEPQNVTIPTNGTRWIDAFLHRNFPNMYYFYNETIASQWSTDVMLSHLFRQRSVFLDTEALSWPTGTRKPMNSPDDTWNTTDWPWDDHNYAFPPRSVFLSYVEAEVSSELTPSGNTPFVVSQMRRASNPPTSLHMHAFQNPTVAASISETFYRLLAYYEYRAFMVGMRPAVPVLYILDPLRFRETLFLYDDTMASYVAANLSGTRFQDRFGLVFNTYWRAYAHGWANLNLKRYSQPGDGLAEDSVNASRIMLASSRPRVLSAAPQTYVTSRPWIAVYFVANAIVLLTSTLSLMLRSKLRGPDILGYVSSIVRYSTYFPRDGDSARDLEGADGFKAAREMKGRRILLGVRWEGVSGGVGSADEERIVLLPEKAGRRISKKGRWR
ncbi:hypothetical protein B0T16DRAFT_458737 [Cercophora newfieldiana]|uniref:Uncharacterized protein n=1 Tax=Cercophora newfieldiana TaxID=92897 RepID=A0AA39Y7K4_9PEZI|nr:hypothetical protein B0T16DRAFT_458737 [Cercophora newfieldiana]